MSKHRRVTLDDALEAVALSLREFGYRDTTRDMIRDVLDAYKSGKREADLPHGVVGRFAESQIAENFDFLSKLPA